NFHFLRKSLLEAEYLQVDVHFTGCSYLGDEGMKRRAKPEPAKGHRYHVVRYLSQFVDGLVEEPETVAIPVGLLGYLFKHFMLKSIKAEAHAGQQRSQAIMKVPRHTFPFCVLCLDQRLHVRVLLRFNE